MRNSKLQASTFMWHFNHYKIHLLRYCHEHLATRRHKTYLVRRHSPVATLAQLNSLQMKNQQLPLTVHSRVASMQEMKQLFFPQFGRSQFKTAEPRVLWSGTDLIYRYLSCSCCSCGRAIRDQRPIQKCPRLRRFKWDRDEIWQVCSTVLD